MKILVTGGTGLLGGRLIPKLVEDGHQIFALTRSASSHDKLKALGASPGDADLRLYQRGGYRHGRCRHTYPQRR
jgi:uncharacterized protein YbjT (DUF2867 family)